MGFLFGKNKNISKGHSSGVKELSKEEKYGQAWLYMASGRQSDGIRLFKELDAAGYDEGSIALAMYTSDQTERKRLVKKAADAGNYEGLWEYCGFLQHSYCPVPGNKADDLWLSYCLKAAENGSVDAMNELGNVYNRKNNYAESMYWYAMANANDHPDGAISMAGIARKWVQAGAPRNKMPGSPKFDEKRFKCAISYLEMHADMRVSMPPQEVVPMVLEGVPIAAYLAGDIFEAIGNEEMAYKMYNAIAFENDAHGLRCLADMLMTGKGTERNVNDAIRMYQEAAELGERGAMFVMGQFEKSSNKLKSAYWYGLSHTRGFEHALSGLMDLV